VPLDIAEVHLHQHIKSKHTFERLAAPDQLKLSLLQAISQ